MLHEICLIHASDRSPALAVEIRDLCSLKYVHSRINRFIMERIASRGSIPQPVRMHN